MIRCFKKTLKICQLFCNVVGLVQQLKLSTRWVNRVRLAEDYQEKEETLFSGKGALKNREDVYLEEYQYIQPAELGGFRLPHPLSDLVSIIREATNQSTYIMCQKCIKIIIPQPRGEPLPQDDQGAVWQGMQDLHQALYHLQVSVQFSISFATLLLDLLYSSIIMI